jgi:hypothetical protein
MAKSIMDACVFCSEPKLVDDEENNLLSVAS